MTDSNALLQCAEQLLAAHGADDETVRRTVANRAYYGAYHACRDAVHRLKLPYFAEVSGARTPANTRRWKPAAPTTAHIPSECVLWLTAANGFCDHCGSTRITNWSARLAGTTWTRR